jgi:hypothetical protein
MPRKVSRDAFSILQYYTEGRGNGLGVKIGTLSPKQDDLESIGVVRMAYLASD